MHPHHTGEGEIEVGCFYKKLPKKWETQLAVHQVMRQMPSSTKLNTNRRSHSSRSKDIIVYVTEVWAQDRQDAQGPKNKVPFSTVLKIALKFKHFK